MYRDNSLVPKEAIRMAALGALTQGSRGYSDIASEVRQFSARIVGPSLDLLGTSIELLKFEGLIEPVTEESRDEDAELVLTESGRAALVDYLRAPVRPGASDLNKLVIAIKLRFIDVLEPSDRAEQLDHLKHMYEGERVRLDDLASHGEWMDGLMADWLAMERDQVNQRIAWCETLLKKI